MQRRLRFLLLLALLVAVPVQGVATTTGSLCMALGGQGPHSHDTTTGEADHPHGSDTTSHTHCGPCVACCASTAIAAALVMASPSTVAAPPQVASLPTPKTLRCDQLDRPPLAA